jgi:hypothetical protein
MSLASKEDLTPRDNKQHIRLDILKVLQNKNRKVNTGYKNCPLQEFTHLAFTNCGHRRSIRK